MGSRDRLAQILDHASYAGAKDIVLTLDWTFAHRRDWGSPAIPQALDLRPSSSSLPEVVTKPRWLTAHARAGRHLT